MYRSALLIITVVLAGCGSRSPSPATAAAPIAANAAATDSATDIDRRAEALVHHGRWDDARQLVDRGLADARGRGDRAGEARLLLRRGRTLTDQARHRGGARDAGAADIEAAHRLGRASGDAALIAATIDALAFQRFTRWFATGDPAELAAAERGFREALAMRGPAGASAGLSQSEFHVGLIHQMRGEPDEARPRFERALAIAEQLHDDALMVHPARHIAYLAELRHDWDLAEAMYRRSLELTERAGSGPMIAAARVTLAESRYARDGAAQPALALLGSALAEAARVGTTAYVAISRAAIARVHRDLGESDAALRELAAAIAAVDSMHSSADVPEMYEQRALIELLRGRADAALADVDRGLARGASPRLHALRALALARAGRTAASPAAAPGDAGKDAVVAARLALAAGDARAAFDAALTADDPDTLLLAARALGGDAACRASRAPSLPRAQALRFERECGRR
jgi:tetratricopeptide (TPR) repeat protein